MTGTLLPLLLHLKLVLVAIRAAKLSWSTAGAQTDAQVPPEDTQNIRVFKPNAAHNLKLARLSPASFARLAGILLLVSLRVVGSASWQLAGQCLPWACNSFARRPL